MTNQKEVLVIGDDQTISRAIKNLLTADGYAVYIANTGSEGIQKAFEIIPDLSICAIKMKPIGGFQVIKILKDTKANAAAILRRIYLGNTGHDKMDMVLKRKDDKELEVIELCCDGLLIKEIAEKLYISDRTVEKHRAIGFPDYGFILK
jgi:DNA-binding NarL/FixJ family response regulator